jgi:DNA repair ATPase RecN
MKYCFSLIALAAFAFAAPAAAQKDPLGDIVAQMQQPLKDLSALQDKEKQLKNSEDAQVLADQAEKKARAELQPKIDEVMMDAQRADQMRQHLLDIGCPENGGEAPQSLVDKCNPLIDEHIAFVAKTKSTAMEIKDEKDKLDQLRDSISITVLANVQKRKDLQSQREDLTGKIEGLEALGITEVIKHSKLAAAKACDSACCHKVVYDGADPKLCGVGIVCQSFEKAGLFHTKEPFCAVALRNEPAVIPAE